MPNTTKERFEEKFTRGYKDVFRHSVNEIVRDEHYKFLQSELSLLRKEMAERVRAEKGEWQSPEFKRGLESAAQLIEKE